jgi:hypothetical protein
MRKTHLGGVWYQVNTFTQLGNRVQVTTRLFPSGQFWEQSRHQDKGGSWIQDYLLLNDNSVLWVHYRLRDIINANLPTKEKEGYRLDIKREGLGPNTTYELLSCVKAGIVPGRVEAVSAMKTKNPCVCGAHIQGVHPFQAGHSGWCDVAVGRG